MARSHFVKKARKDVAGTDIKAGDSYYWWQFKGGRKQCSKTAPKASQLTQSAFWAPVYALQEREQPSFDDLESEIDDIKSELQNIGSECESSLSNMPDSLQQGPTGEMLQGRVDAMQDVESELDGINVPDIDELRDEYRDTLDEDESDKFDKLSDEEKDERLVDLKQEKADEVWSEVTSALENISCE